ncbi:RNA polymerase sigma factor [Pseudalkalibacillus sp. R45]|uniref:RNA polymerase sigma factor n=1 Tax=Pseudalkalibacillus sp. R45 TaxID=3457433 RepID=UPI003FCC80B0
MTLNDLKALGEDIREIEQKYKQEIEPFRSDLWHYCYKLTKSPWDAEDLVQDTLFKSLAVLAKVYQPVNTKSYIFKIATNLWIDQNRKSKYTYQSLNENLNQELTSSYDFQLIDNLDFLIKQLTPIQYVSFILTEAFQFKAKEIARIIPTSENAVYANLSRARSILKNKVERTSKPKVRAVDLTANGPLKVLLEGFRNKDPEMIASVLSEDVITDITHAGLEMGLEETKKNSLRDWKQIVDTQHVIVAEYKELWGRPVIIELEKKLDNKLYLNNIHVIETYENEIIFWKFYCFSWDLMKLAANELGVELNAKYFYHIF